VALLGRNGAGKTTTLRSIMGVLATENAATIRARWPARSAACRRPRSPGSALQLGYRRSAAIFGQPDGRGEFGASPRLTAPDAWSYQRIYELFPRLRERRKSAGRTLSGGRAADAGDRPGGADPQPPASFCSMSRSRASRP